MRDAFGVVRISKIAMHPVYHGTTKQGAAKLLRLIRSQTPETASFKFSVNKPRADGTNVNRYTTDTRPEGLYTTNSRSSAERYSITGRSPDRGGIGMHNNHGKVLVFNALGVKPKYRGVGEEIYDPKELGHPVAIHDFKRSRAGKESLKAKEQADEYYDSQVAEGRKAVPNYPYKTTSEIQAEGRSKVLNPKVPKPMRPVATPPVAPSSGPRNRRAL